MGSKEETATEKKRDVCADLQKEAEFDHAFLSVVTPH